MPTQYKYKALSEEGYRETGTITAENNEQVLEFLSEKQLHPISIKTQKRKNPFSLWGFFKRAEYENLILFTRNLNTLYRSGIPLLRALSIIKIGKAGGRFNYALSEIRQSLQSGKSLSVAISGFDDLFPSVYVASVAAGEESGKLNDILDQLTAVLEEEYELTRQIKSGTRYPLMVIAALAAAFLILTMYVVPKFVAFYDSFDTELPIITQWLIGLSNFLSHNWMFVFAAIIILVFGGAKLLANKKIRLQIDLAILKLPIFGDLIIKGSVARFCMMFRILIQSGLPLIRALKVLTDSTTNSQIATDIRQMRSLFEEGRDNQLLSGTIKYFPELSLQMMMIGLESGSLETILQEIGQHYSKEVSYTSKHLTSILEPILTVVMACFVLVLALAIFMPMWNLISVFSGH